MAIALNCSSTDNSQLFATFSQPALDRITSELTSLPPRPNLASSFEYLTKAGFEIYAVTNGAVESTQGLLKGLGSEGERFQGEQGKALVVSCDEIGKAKPGPEIVSAL